MNNGIGFIITPKHLAPRILIPFISFRSDPHMCQQNFPLHHCHCFWKSLDNRYKHIFNHILYILYIYHAYMYIYKYTCIDHIKLKVDWSLIISTSVSVIKWQAFTFLPVSFYQNYQAVTKTSPITQGIFYFGPSFSDVLLQIVESGPSCAHHQRRSRRSAAAARHGANADAGGLGKTMKNWMGRRC